MANITVISNSCVGYAVLQRLNQRLNRNIPYDTPFIGTLIPNDVDYIRLCENLDKYLNTEPVLGEPKTESLFCVQNGFKWFKNDLISIPYPVIHVKDVEIHCIHDTHNHGNLFLPVLEKFNRRRKRFLERNNDGKILKILSYSEFFNDHPDIPGLINRFLKTTNEREIAVFLGPPKYYSGQPNYIVIEKWELTVDYVNRKNRISI